MSDERLGKRLGLFPVLLTRQIDGVSLDLTGGIYESRLLTLD